MWNLFKKKSEEHAKSAETAEVVDAQKKNAKKEAAEKAAEKKDTKKEALAQPKAREKTARAKSGAKAEGKKQAARKNPADAAEAYGVLAHPHVSEKSASASSADTYAFVVSPRANKVGIAKAFGRLYGVQPTAVRIVNVPARKKRAGGRWGVQGGWKKAYIRVPKGSSVNVYEGT